LERAAGVRAGHVKHYEDGGAKPYPATRARLAKVLGAPEMEAVEGVCLYSSKQAWR
jgi:hypothetical protein